VVTGVRETRSAPVVVAAIISFMSPSFRMVLAAACLSILWQPFALPSPGRNNDKEEKLATRIESEKNPGKRARLQLRLAKLKLSEADDAYRSRNFDQGKLLLQQYLREIRNSWDTLQGAENGVRKHLGAFKDLEISLREDDRFLEDLRHRVPYPESEAIKEIEKRAARFIIKYWRRFSPAALFPRKGENVRRHPEGRFRPAPVGLSL